MTKPTKRQVLIQEHENLQSKLSSELKKAKPDSTMVAGYTSRISFIEEKLAQNGMDLEEPDNSTFNWDAI